MTMEQFKAEMEKRAYLTRDEEMAFLEGCQFANREPAEYKSNWISVGGPLLPMVGEDVQFLSIVTYRTPQRKVIIDSMSEEKDHIEYGKYAHLSKNTQFWLITEEDNKELGCLEIITHWRPIPSTEIITENPGVASGWFPGKGRIQ